MVRLATGLERSERFRRGLDALARQTGRSADSLAAAARAYLRELRTSHSPRVYAGLVRAGRALVGAGYAHIDYDAAQVERLRALLARRAAVVLPSHKSYLDGGALTVGFHDHGLPPLTVFGGINMAFWPLGTLWRRANMVFIRRGRTDALYRYTLREYLGHLLERGRHLQWFIEGTRSRTGKLGPPKLGLLVYVADAYREGRCEDVVLLPVAIAYDQLREVEEYAGEARGTGKQAESLGWLLRFVRSQRGRFGTIYVRFGEPLPLRDALGPPARLAAPDTDAGRLALQKLAIEVSWRIGQAAPVTGSALATLALLGARGRALTQAQIRAALHGYVAYARTRGLPMTPTAAFEDPLRVAAALDALRDQGVVERYAEGPETVYRIAPGAALAASYYRNTILHFFVLGAIAEVALLRAATAAAERREQALREAALELRDLLKFEFFFAEKQQFLAALDAELSRLAADWRERLALGPAGVSGLLEQAPTLSADVTLRTLAEAYRVVAEVLVATAPDASADEAALLARCMSLGRQYQLQGRIGNPESVSRHLFRTGLQLARQRGLGDPGAAGTQRRREFADALREVLHRLDDVHRIAVRRVQRLVATDGR